MAKVIGIHQFELHAGANQQEFEQFVTEAFIPAAQVSGFTYSLLRGDRGERVGKYLLLIEIESEATRNRYFPEAGQFSEAAQQYEQSVGPLYAKIGTYATVTFTDYVVLGT